MEKRTSLFENGLIWFGARCLMAEILTGTYFSSLGFGQGPAGYSRRPCHRLYHALSRRCHRRNSVRKSAMETAKMSFGSKGGLLFAILNVLQLVGWTAIMIYDGALAADGIIAAGNWVWCLLIGGLIIVWILIGIENLGKVNTVAMAALLILTVILSLPFFGNDTMASAGGRHDVLWRSGGAVRGHAAVLAAPDQ